MAVLDLACLAVLVLASAAGAFAGALAQLASLGAVAAGWAGARWLGPRLVPVLHEDVPAFAAQPLASVIAFAVCAAVAALFLRTLAAALRGRGTLGRVDRAAGALLGGAKAGMVLWVLLSALAAWGRPVHLGPVNLDPAGSELVALAREHSALGASHPPSRRKLPR